MKKIGLAIVLAAATTPAFAQEVAVESPHSFSANVALVSDYRFRGFTQNDFRPALQGGFDYSHASGLYLGNWNSNVSSDLFPGGNLEMDFYGGFAREFDNGLGIDVGVLYYNYPGTTSAKGGTIYNTELYLGMSYGPFYAKYSHGVSDFFGAPDSKNNFYIDLGGDFDLGNGWGAFAHVGYQKLKNDAAINGYFDYSAGITKDVYGWELGATVVATSERAWYQTDNGRDAGRPGVYVSLARSF